MDIEMAVLIWRPAAASVMPHVGSLPPPGVWYLPSGGSICHLSLAANLFKNGWIPLLSVRENWKKNGGGKTACGTAGCCAHTSHPARANTHTHTHTATGSCSVRLALTDDSVAPPAVLRAPPWCVSMRRGGLSCLFSSICRGAEQGVQKVTDARRMLLFTAWLRAEDMFVSP